MRNVFRPLVLLLVVLAGLLGSSAGAAPQIDPTTSARIDELTAARVAAGPIAKSESIELLSRTFLGTPYQANRLVGSATVPEQLVIDFRGLDCFTYLDYVEALARSSGASEATGNAAGRDEFVANLIDVRYTGRQIDFAHRKHFFTDWATTGTAADVTASLSTAAVTVMKRLNAGGRYLAGIPEVDRAVTYIPSSAVDAGVLGALRTGDYLAAYSAAPDLDVTHTGIVVQTASGPVLRNASSLAADNRVVDTPLADYVRTVPGIVVLRS